MPVNVRIGRGTGMWYAFNKVISYAGFCIKECKKWRS
nr:MAG TPA: hypothetical protein [Caudoviricetes sp.]